MYIISLYMVSCMVLVRGAPPADSHKDQFCTDPRTMRKHAAYTEWADAYSCTRHRCQPGGRNLAIYTVGCKRVEAPESAIECEEVVEDTNMQFPYCCTRLRCLVVVRGEVWTRVLGQPWETLPAAPWSHMYKMKKPPPVDGGFQPKGGAAAGPIYELYDPASDGEQVMRTRKEKDCDKPVQRSSPGATPDIVIALSTNSEKKPTKADIDSKFRTHGNNYDGDRSDQPNEIDAEETPAITEKIPEIVSEERMYSDKRGYRGHRDSHPMTSDEQTYLDGRGQRGHKVPETVSDEHLFSDGEKKASKGQKTWARIPQEPWGGNNPYTQQRSYDNPNDFDRERDTAPKTDTVVYRGELSEEKKDKPGSLQTLVNAIGTRMRDIENVVQQMSEKVQPPESGERSRTNMAHQKDTIQEGHFSGKQKKPNEDDYNRFPSQGSSRYLRTGSETTTEPPLFAEDTNINGYFSDPSNNLLRRANRPKEPAETYMVPVNTEGRKKSAASETDEPAIKHKKHTHKKKKSKRGKKKHHRDDKEEKKFNKNPPAELERNAVSLEESTDFGSSESEDEESLEMYGRRPRNYGHLGSSETEESLELYARSPRNHGQFYQRQIDEWLRSLRAHRMARMRKASARAMYHKPIPESAFRDIRRYQKLRYRIL